MNVNDFEKHISNYLDGDLRPSEIEEFEGLLNSNTICKQKFEDYKKMLSQLSGLSTFKTSDNFADQLNKKIYESELTSSTLSKTFLGYNYATITGIAAALGIFMFSISTFMSSESLPVFHLDKLSAKNVESKIKHQDGFLNLVAEDDTSSESEKIDLPKIHLVGGKK